MAKNTTENYPSAAIEGIGNPILQKALSNLQERLGKGAAEAYRNLPEGPDLRLKAHDIRMESIAHIDILLDRLAETMIANGGRVFFAAKASTAVDYLLADPTRAKSELGWQPKVSFEELVRMMVRADVELVSKGLG